MAAPNETEEVQMIELCLDMDIPQCPDYSNIPDGYSPSHPSPEHWQMLDDALELGQDWIRVAVNWGDRNDGEEEVHEEGAYSPSDYFIVSAELREKLTDEELASPVVPCFRD